MSKDQNIHLSARTVREALILMRNLCGTQAKFKEVFNEKCSDLFEKRRIMLHVEDISKTSVFKDMFVDLTNSIQKHKEYVFNENSKTEKYRDVGKILIWNPPHGERETNAMRFMDKLRPLCKENGIFSDPKDLKALPRVIVSVVLSSMIHKFKSIWENDLDMGTIKHILCCRDNLQESLPKIFEFFDKK